MHVLPSAYFPSLAYVRELYFEPVVHLDCKENFIKQSIRSRCEILSANGPLQLNVPIVHQGKQVLENVCIDYSKNWIAEHLKAIESAYANAPHFEYYMHDILALFALKPKYLQQLNLEILRWINQSLGLNLEINFTSVYSAQTPLDKKIWLGREAKITTPYTQVFSEPFDFVSNLSVIDGLMNEGPLLRKHFLPL